MTELPRKTPTLALCSSCDHIWPAFWCPFDMKNIRKLTKGMYCPMCGVTGKGIVVAARVEDHEKYARWLEKELIRVRAADRTIRGAPPRDP